LSEYHSGVETKVLLLKLHCATESAPPVVGVYCRLRCFGPAECVFYWLYGGEKENETNMNVENVGK
jgi:hypothetical protein